MNVNIDVSKEIASLKERSDALSEKIFDAIIENSVNGIFDLNSHPMIINSIFAEIREAKGLASISENIDDFRWCNDTIQKRKFFLASNGIHGDYDKIDIPDKLFIKDNKVDVPFGKGRVMVGTAVRDSVDKTASVRVDRIVKHAKTRKSIKKSKKYLVHDEFNSVSSGDIVEIIECSPVSRSKHFRVLRVK